MSRIDARPLWQRALERRLRTLEDRALADEAIARRTVRITTVRLESTRPAGLRCAGCSKGGAIFGDPKVRALCGKCWRRELRAARRTTSRSAQDHERV